MIEAGSVGLAMAYILCGFWAGPGLLRAGARPGGSVGLGMPFVGQRTYYRTFMAFLCNVFSSRHNLTCRNLEPWRFHSAFRRGGVHRGAADDLAHLACLLRERAHLRLHIFGVQPHYLGHVLCLQQRLRIVQRGLNVLLCIRHCLGVEVLGPGANAGSALLDRTGCLLSRAHELLEGLAGLLKTHLGHRSHFLWNLETFTSIVAHVPLLLANEGASTAPSGFNPEPGPTGRGPVNGSRSVGAAMHPPVGMEARTAAPPGLRSRLAKPTQQRPQRLPPN